MAWSVWRTTQINTGLSFNTRLGALLVHVVRVCSTLPGLGEGLAARATSPPLLVVELFALVGRAALARVELELAVACAEIKRSTTDGAPHAISAT